MNLYFNGNFPENFILLGADREDLVEKAENIVAEAVSLFPQSFIGNQTMFPFEFQYTPPFEKNFGELKRLQGIAAENAGWRKEYCGYILVDINGYCKHESEHYFDMTIKFLSDNNDFWHYIFIVDDSSQKASRALVQKILNYIYCNVVEDKEEKLNREKRHLLSFAEECGLMCTPAVYDLLSNAVVQQKISKEAAKTILMDCSRGNKESSPVNTDVLAAYFCNGTPTVKYMLSEGRFQDFVALCREEKRKEKFENEKV